jgi:hypothetical protein
MAIVDEVQAARTSLQRYLTAMHAAQGLANDEGTRLYPEIWTRLDAALAGARAEGKDTTHLDAVRTRLGAAALDPAGDASSLGTNEAGVAAARDTIAWFVAQYPVLQYTVQDEVPDLGPSKAKKAVFYTIAIVLAVLCVVGYVVARIGMRGGFG